MKGLDAFLRKVKWQPELLRGRVHKVSIVAGGEVSVVVRFGVEEPRARALNQGTLLGIVTIAEGKLSAAVRAHESRGGRSGITAFVPTVEKKS